MKNIIVLVSGGGTNLQALLEAEQAGAFPGGSITCVISSRGDAYALRRAEQFHVKSRVIAKKDYPDFSAYTDAMLLALKEEQADLIVLAGFLTILDERIIAAYPNRIINVHPSLIQAFCGAPSDPSLPEPLPHWKPWWIFRFHLFRKLLS